MFIEISIEVHHHVSCARSAGPQDSAQSAFLQTIDADGFGTAGELTFIAQRRYRALILPRPTARRNQPDTDLHDENDLKFAENVR
jgi:hypothetical protein